jgi:predicted protein tyrosine phosphatase
MPKRRRKLIICHALCLAGATQSQGIAVIALSLARWKSDRNSLQTVEKLRTPLKGTALRKVIWLKSPARVSGPIAGMDAGINNRDRYET